MLRLLPSRGALLLAVSAICAALPGARSASAAEPGDQPADAAAVEFFEKSVRPILAARCQQCHGEKQQKGNLRLDSRAGVLTGGDTSPAVVPGKPDDSLLVDAIRYGDTYQMPPKSQLPAEEIATLVEWVQRGAPWGAEAPAAAAKSVEKFDLAERAKHWSFQPVKAVEPPAVGDAAWVKTPIDRFILAGLEDAGLKPAPAASRHELLRRVTFDLTGLPPTAEEIAAFVGDESPGAYERVVNRLLASPRYGERWARHWLDLVRYSETYGHEFDYEIPNAFRYRDYVIRAINADLPYNQFVVEHIAGDLLPSPRRNASEHFNESIIATGWYLFGEAKHSPVDVRQDEADRIDNQIDVLAKTFLGLSVSCARCHDHKFDAISTKDYYALAGYFQSSRYQQAFIESPEVMQPAIAALGECRRDAERFCQAFVEGELHARVAGLARQLSSPEAPAAKWSEYLQKHAPVNTASLWHPWAVLASAGSEFGERRARLAADLRARLAAAQPQASVVADFSSGTFGEWQATGQAFGDRGIKAGEWAPMGRSQLASRLAPTGAAHSGLLSGKLRGTLRSPTFEIQKPKLLYRLYGNGGHVRLVIDGLQLIQDPIYGGLKFTPIGEDAYWHTQDVSKWVGHRAYIELLDDGDGFLALEQVLQGDGTLPAMTPVAALVQILEGGELKSPGELAAGYQKLLTAAVEVCRARQDSATVDFVSAVRLVSELIEHAPWDTAVDGAALEVLATRKAEAEGRLTAPLLTPAMADGTAENEHVFIRGSHKTLGEEVPRRFLEALGGTGHAPTSTGSGRLQLAEQLVATDNPLVARVLVNRVWHHHFGAGLVRSPDDFGAMGQAPTHPELLDWLAGEFVRQGWSLKELHRLLVLSNTYQMSSRAEAVADEADPQNKLWHRMRVRRLEAEAIRDSLLAVSGTLNDAMYGPGVMPHLTEFMVGRGRPKDSGPLDGDRRRSIYLAVRRNFLSPMFLAFDYPIPFTTIGRRGSSNVPAQALVMMNNPLVYQLADQWGQKISAETAKSPAERVDAMYLAALGRMPQEAERAAALEFVAASGPENPAAAWAELAHVMFNLKEFIFIP